MKHFCTLFLFFFIVISQAICGVTPITSPNASIAITPTARIGETVCITITNTNSGNSTLTVSDIWFVKDGSTQRLEVTQKNASLTSASIHITQNMKIGKYTLQTTHNGYGAKFATFEVVKEQISLNKNVISPDETLTIIGQSLKANNEYTTILNSRNKEFKMSSDGKGSLLYTLMPNEYCAEYDTLIVIDDNLSEVAVLPIKINYKIETSFRDNEGAIYKGVVSDGSQILSINTQTNIPEATKIEHILTYTSELDEILGTPTYEYLSSDFLGSIENQGLLFTIDETNMDNYVNVENGINSLVTYTNPTEFVNNILIKLYGANLITNYYRHNVLAVSDTAKLELRNAPLMLIHGFNSSDACFSELYDYLYSLGEYENFMMHKVDYSESSRKSFNDNSWVIPTNKRELLENVNKKGYAAQKVDIIGHSMGGLLARNYIQNNEEHNINRLITVNTPHSGSQFANFIVDIDNGTEILNNETFLLVCDFLLKKKGKIILKSASELRRIFHEFVSESEAIIDLCVDSRAIKEMNSSEKLIKNTASSHAVSSVVTSDWNVVLMPIFNEVNDMAVSRSSQTGGLNLTQWSFSGISHFDITEHLSFGEHIMKLQGKTSESNHYFTTKGFNPPILEWRKKDNVLRSKSVNTKEWENMSIVQDKQKIELKTVFEESGVQMNLSKSSDITISTMLCLTENYKNKSTTDLDYFYEFPKDYQGNLFLVAMGASTDGKLYIDTLNINLVSDKKPISIKLISDTINIYKEKKSQIKILCEYEDGNIKDISRLANLIEWKYDRNKLKQDGFYFEGLEEGCTPLSVSFGKLSTNAVVSVRNTLGEILIDETSIENQLQQKGDLKIETAENKITVKGLENTYCIIRIYSIAGQLQYDLKQIVNYNETSFKHNLSKGIYVIEILQGGNKFRQKVYVR